MTDRSTFDAAMSALGETTRTGPDLCAPLIHALGVSRAAVSTLGVPLGSETVGASDARAARLEEIQLDLGEGPAWEALASRRPVLEPDVRRSSNTAWPLARHALDEEGLGAVFAFPLGVAGIDVGAIDLYSLTPRDMTAQQVQDATALGRVVARQLLRRALRAARVPDEGAGTWDGRYSRREVHQATGMVIAQMGVSADDALLVLRGHAFATDRSVRDVATDVIDRRLDFTPDP